MPQTIDRASKAFAKTYHTILTTKLKQGSVCKKMFYPKSLAYIVGIDVNSCGAGGALTH